MKNRGRFDTEDDNESQGSAEKCSMPSNRLNSDIETVEADGAKDHSQENNQNEASLQEDESEKKISGFMERKDKGEGSDVEKNTESGLAHASAPLEKIIGKSSGTATKAAISLTPSLLHRDAPETISTGLPPSPPALSTSAAGHRRAHFAIPESGCPVDGNEDRIADSVSPIEHRRDTHPVGDGSTSRSVNSTPRSDNTGLEDRGGQAVSGNRNDNNVDSAIPGYVVGCTEPAPTTFTAVSLLPGSRNAPMAQVIGIESNEQHKRSICGNPLARLFGFVLFGLAVLGGVIAALVILLPNHSEENTNDDPVGGAAETNPTFRPKVSPSRQPSAVGFTPHPTSSRFNQMREVITNSGVSSSDVSFDPQSPQYAALTWLSDTDELQIPINETSRIIQRYLVAVLYYSLEGENWTNQLSFLSKEHECHWIGLSCSRDFGGDLTVVSIRISNNNLGGTLPREIGSLSHLTWLSLDRGKIGGSIESIRNLTGLRHLHLYGNEITSVLPSFLGNMTNLRHLSVGSNKLSSTIPDSLANLKDLSWFVAEANELSGTIPIAFFQNMQRLSTLSLFGNFLTGTLPALDNFTNARSLILAENEIFGTLPSVISEFRKLESLGLWDMKLSGPLPEGLFDLPELAALALGGNEFTGTIPNNIGRLSLLQGLSLERNFLTSTLPSSLGDLLALEGFSVHSNLLSGSIPDGLGNCTLLRMLELGNNQLTSTVPTTFSALTILEWLSVRRNELTGSIDFLCPSDITILYADCKGGEEAEVTCNCCNEIFCCSDEDAVCGYYPDTGTLIKDCIAKGYCWQKS